MPLRQRLGEYFEAATDEQIEGYLRLFDEPTYHRVRQLVPHAFFLPLACSS